MTRQEYMDELCRCLHDVQDQERVDALRYCEEYFDEAGLDHEQQAIEELGKPAKFAAQLKAEAAIRSAEEAHKDDKRSFYDVRKIFIGILALPIALPLLLSAAMLMLTFYLTIILLIIAGILLALCGVTVFVILFFSAVFMPFTASSFVRIGIGFILLGISVLFGMGMTQALRFVVSWFTAMATKLYYKAKEGKRNEI